MRYITAQNIQPEMLLAYPLYAKNGEFLINQGVRLTPSSIARILEADYPGIYIEDTVSKGILPQELVPPELVMQTIKFIKRLLLQIPTGYYNNPRHALTYAQQSSFVMPLIHAVIQSPNPILDRISACPLEEYPYYHAVNVTVLSLLLGLEMDLTGPQLFDLTLAALFHDVGNLFVPQHLLNKRGRLTEEEFGAIADHTEKGFEFLHKKFSLSIEACTGALHHHEHYDGSGYPYRLKQDRISIFGKIIAVASAYHAMISSRPYRKPMLPAAALKTIEDEAGTRFDPEIVSALKKRVAPYPAGFCVQLNTEELCIVYHNHHDAPSRPVLRKIGTDTEERLLDLKNDIAQKKVHICHEILL